MATQQPIRENSTNWPQPLIEPVLEPVTGQSAGIGSGSDSPIHDNYLTAGQTVKSWLLTVDHKRIAILYLVTLSAMFFLGSVAAALIRIELTSPNGQFLSNEHYNRVFSSHGITMIFFFLVPSLPAVLGNFLVPLMIGARDLVFPRLNLLSWYVFIVDCAIYLSALVSDRLDLLHAGLEPLCGWQRLSDYRRNLPRGLLVDLYRDQLYRHDPQDARSRSHLVPASFLVAVPSAVEVFNWITTMYNGWAKFAFMVPFIGFNLTFFPQFIPTFQDGGKANYR